MAAASGMLGGMKLNWSPDPSVCIVLASGGYPGKYETGVPISGIEKAEACGATVFQAGTQIGAQGLETAGGRVLGVTAEGSDLAEAIGRAYHAAGEIHFTGMHYRKDIGAKGLKRYNKSGMGT